MKTGTIALLIILLGQLVVAQKKDTKREKLEIIQSHKIALITEALHLSPEEAQRFWPYYNELAEKRTKLQLRKRNASTNLRKNSKTLSVQEKTKAIDEIVEIRIKEAKLIQEYHEKFKNTLSIEQVIQLHFAEIKFRDQLLKEIKKSNVINKKPNQTH